MSRINQVPPEKASKDVKEIYTALQSKLGKIPNIFLNMGNSAAVLKGYLDLSKAADSSSLSAQLREQIALLVSQENNCGYCLAAHTIIGKGAGLGEKEILQARRGQAVDKKTIAILKFAKAVVDERGRVNERAVADLKAAGISDTELVEIILVVIQTTFTNYFNHITDPKIDFPIAPELS